MIDRERLKNVMAVHADTWMDREALVLAVGGTPSEVMSELERLVEILPGPLGFEWNSPGTVPVTVMRPDVDGPRYHRRATMTPADHASVVMAEVQQALRVRPGEVREHLDRASTAFQALRASVEVSRG